MAGPTTLYLSQDMTTKLSLSNSFFKAIYYHWIVYPGFLIYVYHIYPSLQCDWLDMQCGIFPFYTLLIFYWTTAAYSFPNILRSVKNWCLMAQYLFLKLEAWGLEDNAYEIAIALCGGYFSKRSDNGYGKVIVRAHITLYWLRCINNFCAKSRHPRFVLVMIIIVQDVLTKNQYRHQWFRWHT